MCENLIADVEFAVVDFIHRLELTDIFLIDEITYEDMFEVDCTNSFSVPEKPEYYIYFSNISANISQLQDIARQVKAEFTIIDN